MNYTYLYDFNRERYQELGEQRLACKEELGYEIVENGYLLPKRRGGKFLFGMGGVLDTNRIYVEKSQMNSYAKYTKVLDEEDEMEIYLGGAYEFDESRVMYLEEEVVYLGYLSNHWGHFLTDSTTRLYTFLENGWGGKKYAFLIDEGNEGIMIQNVERFLELLGIKEQMVLINQVTRCKKIIIPEQAYMANCYYSKKFLRVFDKVVSAVDCQKYPQYKDVYLSRTKFPKAKKSEFGEEVFLNLFEKNGYKIIYPEKCSLDEQIAIMRNSAYAAGMIGTVTHNLLFARHEKKMIIINKTHNFNTIQMNINQMCKGDVVYIDAYLAKYGVSIGEGPFLLYYSETLDKFIRDYEMIPVDEKYKSGIWLGLNFEKYENWYCVNRANCMEAHLGKNKERYNYFAPEHLTQVEEKINSLKFL